MSHAEGLLSRQETTGTKSLWLELTSMSGKSLHKTGQEREAVDKWFWTGYCPLPLSWWAWRFSFQFSHFSIYLAFQLLSTQAFRIAWKHYNICHPLNQWFNLLWRLIIAFVFIQWLSFPTNFCDITFYPFVFQPAHIIRFNSCFCVVPFVL